MKASFGVHVPLAPLWNSYVSAGLPSAAELGRLPGQGPRFSAVLSATARFLYPAFLDEASDADLCAALLRFYEAVVDPPLHADAIRCGVGIVRHGLGCVLRGRDPLPARMEACLAPGGPYHVPGLGPAFWSALFQAAQRARRPGWTPAVLAGLRRIGLDCWASGDGPTAVYAGLLGTYERIQTLAPAANALHVDHFLSLVSSMKGRELTSRGFDHADAVADALRRVRSQAPLRRRLKDRGETIAQAQEQMEAALQKNSGAGISVALAAADPAGAGRSGVEWQAHAETLTLWAGRLWEAEDPYPLLASFWEADPIPGAGLWLPAAILHLRDPQAFAPWGEAVRQGYATLDDALDGAGPPAERYRLFNEGAAWLRRRYAIHPLETADVLAALAPDSAGCESGAPTFGGFCADTFWFLRELAADNRREWMEPRETATASPFANRWPNFVGRWRNATSCRSCAASTAGTWRRSRAAAAP